MPESRKEAMKLAQAYKAKHPGASKSSMLKHGWAEWRKIHGEPKKKSSAAKKKSTKKKAKK